MRACSSAAGTKHTTARVLERADEIESLDAGNSVMPKIGRRTVRAGLVHAVCDPVQVAMQEGSAPAGGPLERGLGLTTAKSVTVTDTGCLEPLGLFG